MLFESERVLDMSKIYYAVTPKFCTVTRYADCKAFDKVYGLVMEITDDARKAINASSWCELACVGEIYDDDDFTIEVIDDEE